jgi:hypothetical protein
VKPYDAGQIVLVFVSRNKGEAMEDKESSCEEEYEYYTDTENEADGEDNGKLNI